EQLIRQLVDHALFAAATAVGQDPTDSERRAAVGIDLDRDLIIGAAHATGLHFQHRLGVLHGLLEQVDGLVPAFVFQLLHGAVKDVLGGALLAVPHHGVNELVDQRGLIDRVRQGFTLRDMSFSRHKSSNLSGPPADAVFASAGVMLSLRPLGSVLGATLLAVGDAYGIQRAAHHVIADTRQILHTATAYQHNRVLLQIVADTVNVGRDFNAVGQPHAPDLAQSGIRLLRRLGVHPSADAALLRAGLQSRTCRLVLRRGSTLAHQLIKCRRSLPLLAFFTPND